MKVRLPAPAAIAANADYFELFRGAIRGWQPRRGYRFSIDAVLLAMRAFDARGESVLELGTGAGPVLLALGLNPAYTSLVGLEIQPEMAAFARHNAVLNFPDGDRVEIVEGDLCAPPPAIAGRRFDVVVSNPPYYPLSSGHVNPDGQRAIARHEVACRLEDVLVRARASLRDDGRVFLVYPAPRADAVEEQAPRVGLEVTSVQFVRSQPAYAPRQVLFELSAPTGALAERRPDLHLHDESGAHAGPVADFMRRLERLAHTRAV